jgi:PleD family two-component response regulator
LPLKWGCFVILALWSSLWGFNGGEMKVQSELDKRTTFPVIRPIVVDDTDGVDYIADIVEAGQYELVDVSNAKLLWVEDNPVNQLLATRVLSSFRYHIEVAVNGKIATEKMDKNSCDSILMDLKMPVLGELEASEYIRKGKVYCCRNERL